VRVEVAAYSDTGRVREINEDSFLVDNDLFVFAVADGMGGHAAGEIASATAIETLRASSASGIGLKTAIKNAHQAVRTKAESQQNLSGMGTTMTAIGFSEKQKLVIAHVGDSRAYKFDKKINEAGETISYDLERITKDHSLVEELVDAGQITEEEANVHPRRSVITRALGIDGEIEVDQIDLDFKNGLRYLLCSDGLTSMVRDEDIADILATYSSPEGCAKELVARANQAGGNDNITVVVLDVKDDTIILPNSMRVAQSVPAEEASKAIHDKSGRAMFGLRIFIVIALIGALLAGAYIFAQNYATSGYFLDEKNGEVVLMKGQKGGVLWWNAELDSQSGIEIENLASSDRLLVERNARFETRSAAVKRLDDMRKRQIQNELDIIEEENNTSDTDNSQTLDTSVSLPQATAVTND